MVVVVVVAAVAAAAAAAAATAVVVVVVIVVVVVVVVDESVRALCQPYCGFTRPSHWCVYSFVVGVCLLALFHLSLRSYFVRCFSFVSVALKKRNMWMMKTLRMSIVCRSFTMPYTLPNAKYYVLQTSPHIMHCITHIPSHQIPLDIGFSVYCSMPSSNTTPRFPVRIACYLYHCASSLSRPPRWPSGKASASRAVGPGFESRLRQDFFGVESYQ